MLDHLSAAVKQSTIVSKTLKDLILTKSVGKTSFLSHGDSEPWTDPGKIIALFD